MDDIEPSGGFMIYDTKPLWEAAITREPEAAVMPCRCGAMPAPVTNISGDQRRRCWPCYEAEFRVTMDNWND